MIGGSGSQPMLSQKPPRFSILIPTHNRADVLAVAIRSVLGQSVADFEPAHRRRRLYRSYEGGGRIIRRSAHQLVRSAKSARHRLRQSECRTPARARPLHCVPRPRRPLVSRPSGASRLAARRHRRRACLQQVAHRGPGRTGAAVFLQSGDSEPSDRVVARRHGHHDLFGDAYARVSRRGTANGTRRSCTTPTWSCGIAS